MLLVLYVAPDVGDVIATVGAVVSVKVTVRVAVPVFPAASRAVTVSTFAPGWRAMPVSDQVVVPVAVPLPPRSLDQVTWVTPMSSAAVPPRLRELLLVLYVAPDVGDVIATVGAVVSVKVTVRIAVPVLPAASRAVTVRTFAPGCREIPLADQLVVPVAVPLPPRSLDQVTWVTPTSSEAVPPRVTELLFVPYAALVVGAVMATVGAVVSVKVTVRVAVPVLPAASRAVTVKTFAPGWRATPVADQVVVPVAVPLPPRSLDQLT